ncbi:MAG: SUMF1/EgtB/PvdO family nonheme iron enzyme [Planctomycetes bacterium]|nr:SUMF1/EgtB/PvdO family nonheme iron enzyme [Planctomycetota bacterium]
MDVTSALLELRESPSYARPCEGAAGACVVAPSIQCGTMACDTNGGSESAPPRTAVEILAARLSEAGTCSARELEQLCTEHPDEADELRALQELWHNVIGSLPRAPSARAVDLARLIEDRRASSLAITIDREHADPGLLICDVLRRLVAHRQGPRRYRICGEIARGGMGVVYEVWDADLRRRLAMKVVNDEGAGGHAPARRAERIGRFLEEAQITAQLQHPGIVSVHDFGIDDDGRLFFTMPLIRGVSLARVLDDCSADHEEWALARTLRVFVKVCEAVGYAHAHGVVHRDLKPANVMVGRFGETYVLDWGLAHVLREGHSRHGPADSSLHTDLGGAGSTTPALTADGQVLGTPCYMAPEQARGRGAGSGPRADVYSIGAMLYHLLAGRPPHTRSGQGSTPELVLERVLNEPPEALADVAPTAPRVLAAICERAMTRDPQARYADALEVARDLEAFLDDRPTIAADPGRFGLLRLALRRNRAVAAVVATAFLVVFTLLTGALVQRGRVVERQRLSAARQARMLDFMSAQALTDQFESTYPIHPDRIEVMRTWLQRADDLLSRRPSYVAERAAAATTDPPTGEERDRMLANMERIEQARDRLRLDVAKAEALARGLDAEDAARWDEAIADVARSPVYRHLPLTRQTGLVPLGRDRDSGLWEFLVVASGERPRPDPRGRGYDLDARSGLVLVLLPGGPVTTGSPLSEPYRRRNEVRQDHVLEPFFLGKYEVSQALWTEVMSENPSGMRAGMVVEGERFTLQNPVEQVSWNSGVRFANRLGLTLPTEAQWEYACRAGEATAYPGGDDPVSLRGMENLFFPADPGGDQNGVEWHDGYVLHAPVGRFEPNGFGLHDMRGNVSEWCLDEYFMSDDAVEHAVPGSSVWRVLRGGSFLSSPDTARAAFRNYGVEGTSTIATGLRVARALE